MGSTWQNVFFYLQTQANKIDFEKVERKNLVEKKIMSAIGGEGEKETREM